MVPKAIAHLGILFATVLITGCRPGRGEECRIHGVMEDHLRDGRKIYLVPLERPDSVGVDSTEIRDGRFEFKTRKKMLAIVRVELMSRYGTQELLVVTEPGDVNARIGSTSSVGGTPQNDVLQQWKERTQRHAEQVAACRTRGRNAIQAGDNLTAEAVKAEADSLLHAYKEYTRSLAEGLEEGVLRDFLEKRFPAQSTEQQP